MLLTFRFHGYDILSILWSCFMIFIIATFQCKFWEKRTVRTFQLRQATAWFNFRIRDYTELMNINFSEPRVYWKDLFDRISNFSKTHLQRRVTISLKRIVSNNIYLFHWLLLIYDIKSVINSSGCRRFLIGSQHKK